MARTAKFEQITGLTVVKTLTPPTDRTYGGLTALVQAEGAPVRYRSDGTDPTAAIGHRIPVGGAVAFVNELDTIKFLQESATAKLNVSYYGSTDDIPLIEGGADPAAAGGGGGAATIADGADVTQGAIADPVVAAGAAGTEAAKLRRLTTDLAALIALHPASIGAKARASSLAVALSTEDQAFLDGLETLLAGGLPASLGAKARASSLAATLSTEDQALITAISTALSQNHAKTVVTLAIAQVGTAASLDLVALDASNKIKVVGVFGTISADGTLKFQYGTGPTALTGAMDLKAGGGFVMGFNNPEVPIMETPVNNKLTLVSTGGGFNGLISYYKEA